MSTRDRPVYRGTQRGLESLRSVGREIRLARRSLGLSQSAVAASVGMSGPSLSRIERGVAPYASLHALCRLCAVVGLDLSVRTYAGGRPIRDARHAELLSRFKDRLHQSLRWRTEVPLPSPGDPRAWDATITGAGWRYGIEAEMHPTDGQAVTRRLALKRRDGGVDGLIVLLPDTRQARAFRAEFGLLMADDYPVPGRRALELLAAGVDPGGSSIVVV